jgi:hypothetical protein
MNPGSSKDWSIKTLQVANICAVEENIHVRPQLASFIAEIEAQTRKILFQRINNLTDGSSRYGHGGEIANFRA